jgi:hypothetical protein
MCNRRRIIFAAMSSIAATGCASAQTGVDGPRGRFDDDLIANLEGQWRIARQIRGTTVHNAARAAWVLNHQFLQLHMKDVADPPQYEAIVLIGYVYSDKQYVAFWTDTFGAKFAGVGRGTRNGHTVEFRFGEPEVTFFNTFTWFPERREWVFRMESPAASGGRALFAVDTLSHLQ